MDLAMAGNFLGFFAMLLVGIIAIRAAFAVVHAVNSFIHRPRVTGVNMGRYEQVVEELVGAVDWTRDQGGAGLVVVNPVCQRNVYRYVALRRRGLTEEAAKAEVWNRPIMQPVDDPIPVFAQQVEAEQRYVIVQHIRDDSVARAVQEAAVNRVIGEQPNPHGMVYIDGYLYNTAPKPSIVARDDQRPEIKSEEIPMALRPMGPEARIDVTESWPRAKKTTRKSG